MRKILRKGTEHFTGQSLFYPIIYFELVQTNPKVYPYTDMVDRRVQKYHVHPNIQFSTMDIQATYAMVDAGLGISITNRINSLTNYPGVCHRSIVPTDVLEIGLACEKDLAPACRLFLEFLLPRLP